MTNNQKLSITLQEWSEQTAFDNNSQLAGVVLQDVHAKNIAKQLTQAGMLTINEMRDGLSIASTSYVGKVTIGNIQISVHPKIPGIQLAKFMPYAYDLHMFPVTTQTPYDSEEYGFQEIILAQLAAEAKELLARGLYRRYIQTTDMLVSPHGRIDLQRIAKQGGIIQPAIPVTHYPRLEDCLVNQVLLQGLQLAASLTNNHSLKRTFHQLISVLEEHVSAIDLQGHILKRVHREMNRLLSAYQPTITLIELLLAGEGISFQEEQQQVRLPGFLFDMNRFFQMLLSRYLSEHLSEYEVRDQYKMYDMMLYDPNYNPQKRHAPTPRPDYVILQDKQIVSILDAKYRDLWDLPLPPHMLYQLAIYALSQSGAVDATILYPTMHTEASEARILLRGVVYGERQAQVILRPVNLSILERMIEDAQMHRNEKERISFAKWLAFGKK